MIAVDTLKYTGGHWLQHREKEEAADLMLLTVAAYLFRVMILNHNGPDPVLAFEDIGSVMTWRLLCG